MKANNKSKAWDWSQVPKDSWNVVSDEFVPVALRWKLLGKRTVLDIGCGRGRNAIFLAELGFHVTAVDLSPEGIEQLEERTKQQDLTGNITTLVCDMLKLPFDTGSFDCVLAFNSIYHTDYESLKVITSNIHRYLNESGRVFISFNTKRGSSFNNPKNRKIDDHTMMKMDGLEKGILHTYINKAEILELMSDYDIIKLQYVEIYQLQKTNSRYFVEAKKKPKY